MEKPIFAFSVGRQFEGPNMAILQEGRNASSLWE
jgi:hypothetical protein